MEKLSRSQRERRRKKARRERRKNGIAMGASTREQPPNVEQPEFKKSRPSGAPGNEWAPVGGPPKLRDYALELRALREGWLVGKPKNLQQVVRDVIVQIVTSDKTSDAMKLRASLAILSLYKRLEDLLKAEAAIAAKSHELQESTAPTTTVEPDNTAQIVEVLAMLLEDSQTPEEVSTLETLALRTGLLADLGCESFPNQTQ